MRGKAAAAGQPVQAYRITPAHAGKSMARQFQQFLGGDHPRSCGEKQLRPYAGHADLGSPPLMRGKVHIRRAFSVCAGITPAHAGKRHYSSGYVTKYGDHPRSCGEKLAYSTAILATLRITPAHAGKSTWDSGGEIPL